MFEIYAASAGQHPDVVARIENADLIPRGQARDDAPFLQVGYDEIDPEELDRILSYAEISRTNGPVGLPRLLNPIAGGNDWVLFPIGGLRRHLSEALSSATPSTSVAEFITAVDEVAECCERNDLLMLFRW